MTESRWLRRLKEINARAPAEDSVALRAAVLAAVMAAVLAVLDVGVGNALLGPAAIIGIPAGFAFSHLTRHRSGLVVKLFLAVGATMAFVSFLSQFGGLLDGRTTAVQIPLTELFLWVQLLHSFDVPARRDLLFSLVSSFVLLAVAGVFADSMAFGVYLIAWAVAGVTALVLSHRSELGTFPALGPTARPRSVWAVVRPLAVVLGIVVLLAPLVFLVVPAAGAARALALPAELPSLVPVPLAGGLANPSLGGGDPALPSNAPSVNRRTPRASFGYFGFATSLDTAARGRPDNTLVMKVRASKPDFWRGQTFDHWDGRRWTVSVPGDRPVGGRIRHDVPVLPDDVYANFGDELVQTYYVKRPGPNMLFAAYTPTRVYFPDSVIRQLPDGSLRAGVQLDDGAVYTVISRRPHVTAERLRASRGVVPQRLRRYTQLPDDLPARVRRLAADVTASSPTTYDAVLALQRWMATHTRYSLRVPPLPRGADAVDRYLFVDKVGFCEQIGTSLVVLLRSLGVPARLAVGYLPGERNPFTGLYEVKAKDAHAWAEVWFPGVGWQGFDPTADVPLAGEIGTLSAGAGLARYLSAHLPDVSRYVVPAAAVAGLLVAAGGAVVLLGRTRRRRLHPPSWAATWVAGLERAGARRGRPRAPNETLREYATVFEDTGLAEAVELVELEAWGGEELPPEERARADSVLVNL